LKWLAICDQKIGGWLRARLTLDAAFIWEPDKKQEKWGERQRRSLFFIFQTLRGQ